MVRELVPRSVKPWQPCEDEAAILLGASGWQMFRRVTLPNIRWALLYGGVDQRPRNWRVWRGVGGFRPDGGETLSLPLQIELLEQDHNTVGSLLRRCVNADGDYHPVFKSMLQWRPENQENAHSRRNIMSIEIANIKKAAGRTQSNDISLIFLQVRWSRCWAVRFRKTTLLRIIAAGASNQRIFASTALRRQPPPHARSYRSVSCSSMLFRHMTVFDGSLLGPTVLPRRERPNAAAIKAATKLLEMVQLAHLADQHSHSFPAGCETARRWRARWLEPQILPL